MHPHLEWLKENVFKAESRWPHFLLNLSDMDHLHKKYGDKRVLSLERSIQGTCGKAEGDSRWRPLFSNLVVVNHGMYDDRHDYMLPDHVLDEDWDLVIVPNLLHHVADQQGFFAALEFLNIEGELYIFDTVIHELHDMPHDYIRYTPYGIRDILERHGFKINSIRKTGNHMSAIRYFLDYAKHNGLESLENIDMEKLNELSLGESNAACMYWSVRAS